MNKIGLTGGIACGKSTACKWFSEKMGWGVLDTDHVAHDLLRPGTNIYEELVAEFGTKILMKDGAVDRSVLGRLVFDDSAELKKLNKIIHPAVRERTKEWLASQTSVSLVTIPLLFENELQSDFDTIICVAAGEEAQVKRLKERGFGRSEALKRIRAQMPVVKKSILSDYVVYNDKSLSLLHEQLAYIARDFRRE